MIDDVAGGPGWIIRAADLRPAITDVGLFREGLGADPLAGPIESLWSGKPAEALAALEPMPPTLRVRALRAECKRDLQDFTQAIHEFDALVDECAGTSREAVMRQHRGKALLVAGETARAIDDFAAAVALREGGDGHDPTLLASSQQALAVARAQLAASRQQLIVDGETFVIERLESHGYHLGWASGPNPGYGFSVWRSDQGDVDDAELTQHVRSFLAQIDPATGYLPD